MHVLTIAHVSRLKEATTVWRVPVLAGVTAAARHRQSWWSAVLWSHTLVYSSNALVHITETAARSS